LAHTRLWPQLLSKNAATTTAADDKINVLFIRLILMVKKCELRFLQRMVY
jgi:hypothetical protein